jgi:hypothetical protein
VVFTAAAVVTGLLALNRRSEFNDENRADVPSSEKEDLHDSAVTMSWISTGLTAAAVVSGGLATYLFVAPASTETAGPGGSTFSGAVVSLRGGF